MKHSIFGVQISDTSIIYINQQTKQHLYQVSFKKYHILFRYLTYKQFHTNHNQNGKIQLSSVPYLPYSQHPIFLSSHYSQNGTQQINFIQYFAKMLELNWKRLLTWHFMTVVLFISFYYYLFVVEYMILLNPSYKLAGMIVFHFFFFMVLWCMFMSVFSEPGRVPIYWGFFLDEKQSKKRRYCLICHSFKPQRCHHCSTCQRCVLNMDHHCPWIANCVGYMNRKFFLLFLFYVIVTILVAICFMIPLFINEISLVIRNPRYLLEVHPIIRILGPIFLLIFEIIIGLFFKFHIELVLSNSSTLDNLQRERNKQTAAQTNSYDLGKYQNWLQVFGKQVFLWPFPFFGESGRPKGDGVQWDKNDE